MRTAHFQSLCVILLLAASTFAQPNPVPIIFKPLVPGAVTPGSTGFTLTVNGANFVPGAVVKWNGHTRSTRFVSSTKVQAKILASDVPTPGTASVTVLNPTPGHGTSNVGLFLVTNPTTSVSFTQNDMDGLVFDATGFASGDWDNDGNMDVTVVGDFGSGMLKSFLGNGDGTLQLVQTKMFGATEGGRMGVGDLNGEGIVDLAVPTDSGIAFFRGAGDGTFRSAASVISLPVKSIALADFNRDGILDLAANQGEAGVGIALGKGGFSFGPLVTYAPDSSPFDVVVGDFNRDGNLDFATCNGSANTVSVFLGNGDGTFESANNYATGSFAIRMDTGDLNGDGVLDLVVADEEDDSVSVLLGNGDGSFQPYQSYSTINGPVPVALADLNGDGILDLVTGLVFDTSEGGIGVNLGNGDGTFGPAHKLPKVLANSFTIADLNGDGHLDVVSQADDVGEPLTVLLQTSQ